MPRQVIIPNEVTMRRAPAAVAVAACAMALGASGCAHANRPVVLERPAAGATVSRLSDLPSMPGAYVVVLLRSGESARGAVETIDGNVLVLRVTEDESTTGRVAEEDIVCLARRVGKSTTARGWLGALIGAAVSLPFGISMAGDMMMPAAIAGALIAGNTGQPRARVLLDRSHPGASGRACPASLPATDAGRLYFEISANPARDVVTLSETRRTPRSEGGRRPVVY